MPRAFRNSSNDMGYINMEWILPTPKVGISLSANSKREPAAITCSQACLPRKSAKKKWLPGTSESHRKKQSLSRNNRFTCYRLNHLYNMLCISIAFEYLKVCRLAFKVDFNKIVKLFRQVANGRGFAYLSGSSE